MNEPSLYDIILQASLMHREGYDALWISLTRLHVAGAQKAGCHEQPGILISSRQFNAHTFTQPSGRGRFGLV